MLKEKNKLIRKIQLFIDICITAVAFLISCFVINYIDSSFQAADLIHYNLRFLFIILLPLWAILLHYNGGYCSIRTKVFFQTLLPILKSVVTGGIILITVPFIFKVNVLNGKLILTFLLINFILLVSGRACLFIFLHNVRKKGYNFRTLLILGTGKRAIGFAKTVLSHKEWGLNIIGFIDIDPSKVDQVILGKRVLGLSKDITNILTQYQVDEVVFVGPRSWLDQIGETVLSCEEMGLSVRIACDFYPRKLSMIHFDDSIADWPLVTVTPPPHYGNLIIVKLALDILFSITILLLTLPLLLLIALCIKLTSPGPVLFKQERCGLNGRRFKLLKFRTMVNNAEVIKPQIEHLNEMLGPVFKIHNDPRVTTFGKLLRKFSLDELPQLINVLKNDMSIVGPRPPLPEEVRKYDLIHRRRLSAKPGITCLWQVNGRNKLSFKEWMKLDLEYIDNWSLGLDMKIMMKTALVVLKGTGL